MVAAVAIAPAARRPRVAPDRAGHAVGLAAVRAQPEPADRRVVAGQCARQCADHARLRPGHAADDGAADLVGRAHGPLAATTGRAHGRGDDRAVRRPAHPRRAVAGARTGPARSAQRAGLPHPCRHERCGGRARARRGAAPEGLRRARRTSAAPGRRLHGAVRRAAGTAGAADRKGDAAGLRRSRAGARGGGAAGRAGRGRRVARAARLGVAAAGRRSSGNGARAGARTARAPVDRARTTLAAAPAQWRTRRDAGRPRRCAGRLPRWFPAGAAGSGGGAVADPDRRVLGRPRGRPDPAVHPAAGAGFHDAGGLGRGSGQPPPVAGAGADGRPIEIACVASA